MGPEEQALLEQLKDVALPADPGWWPLAIGWWIAILAALIVCGVAYFLINRVLKKREQDTWRTMALIEHQRISDEFSTGKNRNKTLAELSVLMRRVALAVQSRRSVASLTDDQWLQSLDIIGETSEYTDGVGNLLYRHQYQRELQIDDDAVSELFELTKSTVKKAGHHTSNRPGQRREGARVAAL